MENFEDSNSVKQVYIAALALSGMNSALTSQTESYLNLHFLTKPHYPLSRTFHHHVSRSIRSPNPPAFKLQLQYQLYRYRRTVHTIPVRRVQRQSTAEEGRCDTMQRMWAQGAVQGEDEEVCLALSILAGTELWRGLTGYGLLQDGAI